jgi:YfiH family protein
MVILKSKLLDEIPGIKFGFSTKIGLDRKAPFFFNMSMTVKDIPDIVVENRTAFFNYFGLTYDDIVLQRQAHTDIITFVEKGGQIGESDALITDKLNVGLAISSADCTPVFIYDKKNRLIAGVHSGWRGTEKRILQKTLEKMFSDFGCSPENLFIYIGPSISQKNYEVGSEVANLFYEKYTRQRGNKFLLDVNSANYDMIIEAGVPVKNIENSNLCSYEMKDLLHSYRRDGLQSGRALGVIVLKEQNAV